MNALPVPAALLRRPTLMTLSRDPRAERALQIMLDLDSTVFPLMPAMAMHAGGERVNYADCPSWFGLADLCAGETPDERLQTMLALFNKAWEPDTMRAVGAFPGAVETVKALVEHGVKIHVFTHRPENLYDSTVTYLDEIDLPYHELVVHPKADKVAYCNQHGIQVAVDDHPDFIERASAAGIDVRALQFHYNAEQIAAAGIPVTRDWTTLSGQLMDIVELHTILDVTTGGALAPAAA